jgi:hypothetical protein
VATTLDQQEELFERHASSMHRALVIEDEARSLVRDLPGVVLVKGVPSAHLDHDDPSRRTFQDVDALVPGPLVDSTVAHMAGRGARDLPPRTVDWDRRFAKDITFVMPSGVEVDLHRTLVPGPFGFAVDIDELVAGTAPFDLGGVTAFALAPERRAIASTLALTAGEASPRLAASLDLVGSLGRHGADVDEVVRLSERWRVASLVAEGVCWSASQLGEDRLPSELRRWASTRVDTAWERRWRRLYRSGGGTNTATLLGGVLGMRRWGDRLAYLSGLVRPSEEYRRARSRSARPDEWRTGARELLRRRA